MPLVVIGINHRTAPVDIREKVVFAGEELPAALQGLTRLPGVREALIVSTCNRTELYCFADSGATGGESSDAVTAALGLESAPVPLSRNVSGNGPGDVSANVTSSVADWLAAWHDLSTHRLDINNSLYRLQGSAAVQHLFAVACGLDSLVIGEPQILGQLKDAYRAALEQKVTGPYLNRVMQTTFSVAKRVRTQTRIGANAVSVASAAVSLARTVFEKFSGHTALLVGAGETIALAARHLHAHGLGRMIVANRSLGRAQELAAEFKGFAIGIDDIATHLPEADIVITSTASPTPVITYKAVLAAVRARKRKPIFMVDIAVPRDIEAEVAQIEDVYLFTIDDLQNVVNENLASRREAARDATEMLANEVSRFEQQLKTLDAVPTIRQLRYDAETVRQQTAEQARRMLMAGRDPREVVDFLASTLTNRLLHGPSQRLRQAAERGEVELLDAARTLFAPADQTPHQPHESHESLEPQNRTE